MTGIAIVFLLISAVLIWGGLIASIVFLSLRPHVARYPVGGEEDDPDADD